MSLHEQISALREKAEQAVARVSSAVDMEALEIEFLGRKGALAALMKQMAEAAAEERPRLGALANEVKLAIEGRFAEAKQALEQSTLTMRLQMERSDVTEPGLSPAQGHTHIVNTAIEEIATIFEKVGFVRRRYPEVEWDWYAFEALNMPKDHPARDEWETFFMDAPVSAKNGKMILTPHTSSGQIREMQRGELPIRMINIAKTYRRQSDATHVPMFHQFEGLYIDKNVSIAHLRGILDHFVHAFFGPTRRVRIRPFHFRFTEPSFEIDISCSVCDGGGLVDGQKCRVCKRGWLELGGAGLVHPHVLEAGGIDPSAYSGVAFGWGVERTYMMKEGMHIDDLRLLYKNDVRFLQQF